MNGLVLWLTLLALLLGPMAVPLVQLIHIELALEQTMNELEEILDDKATTI